MSRDRDLTRVGAALAAPARAVFVNLLLDGTARPAGELGRAAGVRASTASEHLGVLVDAGLVTCEKRGRHRYYALAGPDVASAVEALGSVADSLPVTSLRRSREAHRLGAARFCYDHLAGRLAVALVDAWTDGGWLRDRDALALTDTGAAGFRELGVDVDGAVRTRRPTTRVCLDWTERRLHLSGALGAAVASRFVEAGWVTRHASGRGVAVTSAGRDLLQGAWGIAA
ncbi:DNA-binding transcriptional regulator, ArsR family [Prauserella aidingensis]|uniref:ArsR/SmtB family transcription factor n=1 Tax=Prauserella aidingensis TaxID=387890 RepID=UPI0020A4DF4E|nr:helix-turn-helix domain-containing protein [Prauserella aidingensis]MCP2255657.1 DNA-binding transcriptional regulator, ArsR family [Prauserella aidingensis]